jgi:hypothetical protein
MVWCRECGEHFDRPEGSPDVCESVPARRREGPAHQAAVAPRAGYSPKRSEWLPVRTNVISSPTIR